MNLLKVRTADDILTEPDVGIDWLWEPYLPLGTLAVLASYPKVGKSTLAYPLALAIQRGVPFLGGATKQKNVLILAVEEHPQDVQRRLRALRAHDVPLHLHRGGLPPTAALHLELREYVRAQQIGLVILDTLAHFWRGIVDDENDNMQVLKAVAPFLELARATGAAVLLLHHERKSAGTAGKTIRGGGALLGIADQAFLYGYTRAGRRSAKRVLETIGRYAESPASQVVLYERGAFRVDRTDPEQIRGGFDAPTPPTRPPEEADGGDGGR